MAVPLDYRSRSTGQPREPGRVALWLMKPIGWPMWLIYLPLWGSWLYAALFPPEDDQGAMATFFAAFILNLPLVTRLALLVILRRAYPCHRKRISQRRRNAMVALAALPVLVTLLLAADVPLAIGFRLSLPAMNRLHQWAVAHPGRTLPAQRVGIYWSHGILASPTGVIFLVDGSYDMYDHGNGFYSGNHAPQNVAVRKPMSDPLWHS